MSNHTPGPWLSKLRRPNQYASGAWYVEAPDGYIPAMSPADSDKRDWQEKRANARLIAASPDLLEALCGLVLEIEAYGEPEQAIFEAVKDAQDAITKATESEARRD